MVRDMTEGVPSKILLSFSIPMILSGIFQQFYNIADSVIAGNFAGVDALAAVGASYPITMLFIAVATGGGMGCSVIISQLFGAKKIARMKSAVSTVVIIMVALSVILTIAGVFICNPLMRLLNTPANVFEDSALYLRIYIFGLFFLFLYNICNAVFNGLGDSRTPLYFLIFSSVFNIALDIVFVAEFKMGVAGVAWATFIAQGISSVLSVVCLMKRVAGIKSEMEEEDKMVFFDTSLIGKIAYIAIPSILQQSIVSIGQIFVQALVNSYGSAVVAGYSSAIKLDSFFKMVLISISNAASSFAAQNKGAGKLERIGEGRRAAYLFTAVYGFFALILIFFTAEGMIGLFVDSASNQKVIEVGATYMRVVSVFYIPAGMLFTNNAVMRGIGYMRAFTTVTLLDLFLRVAGAYILAYFISYNAIWWGIPLGWIGGLILSMFFYRRVDWKSAS
jgi:putative MATE family efflux protein